MLCNSISDWSILRNPLHYTHLKGESGDEDGSQHLPVASEEGAVQRTVSLVDANVVGAVDLLVKGTTGSLLRD